LNSWNLQELREWFCIVDEVCNRCSNHVDICSSSGRTIKVVESFPFIWIECTFVCFDEFCLLIRRSWLFRNCHWSVWRRKEGLPCRRVSNTHPSLWNWVALLFVHSQKEAF
jgi:hypothetical protein